MIILGVDVETTGLEKDDQIVEMGAVLYDTESKVVLSSFGKIYKTTKWGAEAAECHKIDRNLSLMMPDIDENGIDPWDAVSADLAKYIVAHNATCDYQFITNRWPSFKQKPWLCTQRDFIHTNVLKKVSSYRLGHLAVDYGIIVLDWHRALTDAIICAQIAGYHDLDEAYERKMTPKFHLFANGGRIKEQKELLWQAPSVVDGIGGKYMWDPSIKSWHKCGLISEYIELDAKYIKKVMRGAKPEWSFRLEKIESPGY